MIRYWLTVILFCWATLGFSQKDYSAIWLDYNHRNTLNQKWITFSDYGYRVRFGFKHDYQRLHARTGFGYKATKNVSLWSGIGLFGVSSPDFMNAVEFRPWQGIKVKGPTWGRFMLKNYLRFEERFQFYKASNDLLYSHFTWKLRYLLEVNYTFNQPENDKGKWVGFVSFEPFFNLYSNSKPYEVTTSRSIVGMSYYFSKKTKVNVLYCYETGNIPFLENEPLYEDIVRISLIQLF